MASIAAQSAGEIETIISQKASQVQAQANNLGKLRWRGFTSEIQNIVGDLPKVPILSWVRANSGQALAKRRAAGLPTMGLAMLSMASISWHPTTRKGGRDRKSVVKGMRVAVRIDLGGIRIINKEKID